MPPRQNNRFAELLSQIGREVTFRHTSEVCCGDLTLEQFQTLRAVEKSQRASIGSLSLELRVDLSTMSRNISVLERNSYLSRTRSAEDRRIVHVKLTAKGRRELETLRCGEREVMQDVYDRLPMTDRPQVLKALELLRLCFDRSDDRAHVCCTPDIGAGAAP